MKNEYVAYTDGGCITYLGIGAWACVVVSPSGTRTIYSGCKRNTTNNQMEFAGVIAAMENTPRESPLVIRSDSQYVLNCCTKWGEKWKQFGWRFSLHGQKPIKNLELVKRCHELKAGRKVKWEWVRGHNGDPMNELCDAICNAHIQKMVDRR